jgi:TetR/AcrR family transcriptional regulator
MVHPAETTDVRKSALTAALRLFATHGFDATPIQAVADAVGVSKQAILHHFATKELLRRAVLDTILTHWNETLPRLLLAATASQDRFDAVFGELFRFFAEDRDRARIVLRETLDRPEEVRTLFKGPVRAWLGAIAQYIQAGQERLLHFPDVDAEVYVVHILQLVLTAVASYPVASAVLSHDARKRYDRELSRIARASLFRPDFPLQASAPEKPKRPSTRSTK